ncbi:MAG: LacI family DNA-binding transcriptional regulator [Thalassovita sp.]
MAQHAGVSVGTVSNVLNSRGVVSDKTRKKVQASIKALAFSSNMLARGMRGQRFPVVGLCLPYGISSNFMSLADSLEQRAVNSNYELLQVYTRHSSQLELARVQQLIASRVSGAILVPTQQHQRVLQLLHDSKMPTVLINSIGNDTTQFDRVQVNFRDAHRKAATRLIETGHRLIILVSQFPNFAVIQENIAGVREAIAESDEDVQLVVHKCDTDRASLTGALSELMKAQKGRVALIASSSRLSAWAYITFRELGLKCPEDISLLSTEEPDWAEAAWPTLSAIQQPTREISRLTWDLLSTRMSGEDSARAFVQCEARINFRGSIAEG